MPIIAVEVISLTVKGIGHDPREIGRQPAKGIGHDPREIGHVAMATSP